MRCNATEFSIQLLLILHSIVWNLHCLRHHVQNSKYFKEMKWSTLWIVKVGIVGISLINKRAGILMEACWSASIKRRNNNVPVAILVQYWCNIGVHYIITKLVRPLLLTLICVWWKTSFCVSNLARLKLKYLKHTLTKCTRISFGSLCKLQPNIHGVFLHWASP